MKTLIDNNISLDFVKKDIKEKVGHNIIVQELNKQKKIIHEYQGKIIDVYDNVFLVATNIHNYVVNKSFNYIDFSIGELNYTFE
mgnify:CR=1 FL=1